VLFNSLEFAIFFAIVLAGYALLHTSRRQNVLLLAASYLFYGWWDWRYLGLIAWVSLLDWYVARRIAGSAPLAGRRVWLCLSLINGLGLLAWFKYQGFFLANVQSLADALGVAASVPVLSVVLPVGISFFTFQSASYVVDVYRGETPVCRRPSDYLLFVSFFPQLVAGPIERSGNLLSQLLGERRMTAEGFQLGAAQFAVGWLKKVAIADHLGGYVEQVYGNPGAHNGWTLWIATAAFAAQIYCDFSAYSDMAIGMARVMGFRLMENFAAPYLATNIQEFWRRWHISLSTWFRDYLYRPLGGGRAGLALQLRNVLIVFVISGIWHGANWTFALWGLAHGMLLCVYLLWRRIRPVTWTSLPGSTAFSWSITMVFVLLTWVLFRSQDVVSAKVILAAMFSPVGMPLIGPQLAHALPGILLIAYIELRKEPSTFASWFSSLSPIGRAAMTLTLIIFGLAFISKQGADFIYFQF
jgi:D-alanyl-lipoteichoic acid acyltransferase DltB (MBOAT superfamily)